MPVDCAFETTIERVSILDENGVFDETLRITLHEGRVASATYEAKMP